MPTLRITGTVSLNVDIEIGDGPAEVVQAITRVAGRYPNATITDITFNPGSKATSLVFTFDQMETIVETRAA